MSQGIVKLIRENKKRFYAGEIRNCFYDEPYENRVTSQSTIIIDNQIDEIDSLSLWQNLKTFGQKVSDSLFYQPAN